MSLAVVAKSDDEKRGIMFVAHYCGIADRVACQLGGETSTTSGGEPVTGFNTVCGVLAAAAGKEAELLGDCPQAQAVVDEWMAFRHTHLTPLTDDNLRKLDDRLLSRTFVAGGSSPTLADLVLFDMVYPAVSKFPAAQTLHFCNLLRWWDLLQHTADVGGLYAPLALQMPRFVPPPPPAPPAAKAARSADSGGSSKSTATAAGGKAAAAGGAKANGKPAAAAPAAAAAAAAADGAPAAAKADKKKEKKEGKAAKAPAPAVEVGVDLADIRVGTIVKVGKHPNADSLYLEEIDVGDDAPRQVVSGLVKYVPLDKMQGRRVVVVCNLKPAKMRDVLSHGMVLCASNDQHDAVEPIAPPEGVPNGERVTFEGYARAPEPQLNPKKKVWDAIAEHLVTDAAGTPVYKGVKMTTSKGAVRSGIPSGVVR